MSVQFRLITFYLVSLLSFQLTNGLAKGFGAVKKSTSFPYTGKVQPSAQKPPKLTVPSNILRPDYAADGIPKNGKRGNVWDINPVASEDIPRMRVAGRIAREVLDEAIRMVKPGITTVSIDECVHQATINRNSYPSPLNYHGFPRSCCTSINEVICHGIPDFTILNDGDIVNIDVTIFHDGVHGDCSETVFVGWRAAIDICKPGVPYNEIGGVIEDIVRAKGYTTVKEFCGHGIGRVFHDNPNVLHYKNFQRLGKMAPGHCFTIEPMICMGSNSNVLWPDDWTHTTADGKHTAQFENTLLITESGVEELTGKLPSSPKYAWEA